MTSLEHQREINSVICHKKMHKLSQNIILPIHKLHKLFFLCSIFLVYRLTTNKASKQISGKKISDVSSCSSWSHRFHYHGLVTLCHRLFVVLSVGEISLRLTHITLSAKSHSICGPFIAFYCCDIPRNWVWKKFFFFSLFNIQVYQPDRKTWRHNQFKKR